MNGGLFRSLLVVAVLAAIAAMVLTWNPARIPAGKTGEDPGTAAASANGEAIQSLRAAAELRAFPNASGDRAPLFDELEALGRLLEPPELSVLIAEFDQPPAGDPVTRGVLCALYAQWGRLDPTAARRHLLVKLDEQAESFNTPRGLGPAWFSVLRGWAEIAPEVVLAALESPSPDLYRLENTAERGRWARRHHTSLRSLSGLAAGTAMEQLARADAEGNAGRLPAFSRALDYGFRSHPGAAYRGYFRGLAHKDQFEKHLPALVDEARKIPAEHWPRYREGLTLVRHSSTVYGTALRNPEELVRDIALLYARHDLEAAQKFVYSTGPGETVPRLERRRKFWREWARRQTADPSSVLARVVDEEAREDVAIGLLFRDPSRAAEILAPFPPDTVVFILRTAAQDWKRPPFREEYYLQPDRGILLRSEEERVELMWEVIEKAKLDDTPKRIIQHRFKATLAGDA